MKRYAYKLGKTLKGDIKQLKNSIITMLTIEHKAFIHDSANQGYIPKKLLWMIDCHARNMSNTFDVTFIGISLNLAFIKNCL